MSSCLLDLLSANRSNWMMIIIWAISSLKHFHITFSFFLLTVGLFLFPTPISFYLCSAALSLYMYLSVSLALSFLPGKGSQTFIASQIFLEMSYHSWYYPSHSCQSCIWILKFAVDLWYSTLLKMNNFVLSLSASIEDTEVMPFVFSFQEICEL